MSDEKVSVQSWVLYNVKAIYIQLKISILHFPENTRYYTRCAMDIQFCLKNYELHQNQLHDLQKMVQSIFVVFKWILIGIIACIKI